MKRKNLILRNTDLIKDKKKGQEGYGVIVVIFLLFFFFVLVVGGIAASMRVDRSVENLATKQKEKWEAKAAMSTLNRIIQVRLPEKYQADIQSARACLPQSSGQSTLPVFDEQDFPAANSVPVLRSSENGTTTCNSGAGTYTSLLGNTNAWSTSKVPLWVTEASGFGVDTSKIGVARIAEVVRRYNNVGDPVYQFAFIMDARGGQHYRVREQGEATVGAISQNCGATGQINVSPLTVQEGNPVTVNITYSSVNQLRILNQSNAVIHTVNVTESFDPQTYQWNFTPSATDSYRVEALSNNAGCFSRSEWVQVVITPRPPPCPTVGSFSASSTNVYIGDTITLSWSVTNATQVTIDGEILPASGSRNYTINASRTFTLRAYSASGGCDGNQTINITASPRPPCAPMPAIDNFWANPNSVMSGSGTTLSWQVSNIQAGYQLYIIGSSNGSYYGVSGATGNQWIDQAWIRNPGSYNYTLYAENVCGDGTRFQVTRSLTVNTQACPAPSIDSFTANPSSVTRGNGTTISWSIGNFQGGHIIGSNGSYYSIGASGSQWIDPGWLSSDGTYTYTLYADGGCAGQRQAQLTITVTSPPSPPAPPPPPPPVRSDCQFVFDEEAVQNLVNASGGTAPVTTVAPYLSSPTPYTNGRVTEQRINVSGSFIDFRLVKVGGGGMGGTGGSGMYPPGAGFPVSGSLCFGGRVNHSSEISIHGLVELEIPSENIEDVWVAGSRPTIESQIDWVMTGADTADYGGANYGSLYTTVVNTSSRIGSTAKNVSGLMSANVSHYAFYGVKFYKNNQLYYATFKMKPENTYGFQVGYNYVYDGTMTVCYPEYGLGCFDVPKEKVTEVLQTGRMALCQEGVTTGSSCPY